MNWTIKNIPDQAGKKIIITGANSGLGLETARILAKHGADVIMACRSLERANRAKADIERQHPQATIDVLELDLGNLASISNFVSEYKKRHAKLDILINNAGLMMPPYGQTDDGFELQMGCNHLGHFALSAQLIALLTQSDMGRVITLSSIGHKLGNINLKDLNSERRYNPTKAYTQSKLANLMFSYELDRRLKKAGHTTKSIAVHPGWSATNLMRTSPMIKLFNPIMSQNQEQGALSTIRAAVDPDVESGTYWGPKGFMELKGAPVLRKSSPASHNESKASRLWQISEELTKSKFYF
jgi:NAD(P)-dependent dehydrogenase (short-subunit alcohol dehydrogenase family)